MRRMAGENENKKGRGSSRGLEVKAAILLLAILVSIPASEAATAATIDAPDRACNASIVGAACEDEDEAAGFLLGSESNRRTARRYLLQQGGGGNIGYGALSKNHPVCDAGPGNSYFNCLPTPSNAPSRGCRAYDHCHTH